MENHFTLVLLVYFEFVFIYSTSIFTYMSLDVFDIIIRLGVAFFMPPNFFKEITIEKKVVYRLINDGSRALSKVLHSCPENNLFSFIVLH